MTDEQKKWMRQGARDAYMLLMVALMNDEEKEQALKIITAFEEKEGKKDAASISKRTGQTE